MSGEMLVRHCSPTLAGIKTGNIFRTAYSSRDEMLAFVRHWNALLGCKGLRFVPLQYDGKTALIYAYRPSLLEQDICCGEACDMLRMRGYCTSSCSRCIMKLIERIDEGGEFPHEIGLFLGYPAEDVHGFIENKAENCKCVGCWKVYGDEAAAKARFERYKSCTEQYCRQFEQGQTLERLTVTV